MKKHVWIICLVTIAVLIAACFLFWRQARIERAEMESLCQGSVQRSLESFKEYAEKRDESLYVYGVAEFKSFMNAYHCLSNRPADPTNLLYCNIVYGEMALNPEKVQEHMQKLIDALAILAEDYADPNDYIRLNELGNLLRHGEA